MSSQPESDVIWMGGPLYRKPATTRQEFQQYWLKHGMLATPWFEKVGLKEYWQLHTPDLDAALNGADLSAEDRVLLEVIDGVAVVQGSPQAVETMATDAGSSKYFAAMMVDERCFLHDESGAGAVKKDPPTFTVPTWSVQEWRTWALRVGATEHRFIEDAKCVVNVPIERREELEKLDG